MRVCVVGASGKLGRYMVRHCAGPGARGRRRVPRDQRRQARRVRRPDHGSCPERPTTARSSSGRSRAATACSSCWSRAASTAYSTGTAQAVLDHAEPGARLVFSCGWHITRDGQDVYSWKLKALVNIGGRLARLARFADLDDQVEACRRVFASDTRWTVVRGSDLEEGDSQGLPGVEPACRRPRPREQHHTPCGLRPVHGRRPRERRTRARGPRDRQPPEPFGARARGRLSGAHLAQR